MILFQSTHPLRDATTVKVLRECGYTDFNPRTPYGMRPIALFRQFVLVLFQSTHPLRDATHVISYDYDCILNFNPRTPYGMRPSIKNDGVLVTKISIHAPLTGCDKYMPALVYQNTAFQSTHPLRDATKERKTRKMKGFISIHAPLTGCDWYDTSRCRGCIQISIHAPLTGCDMAWELINKILEISIHAPLTGCDKKLNWTVANMLDFNPRTPYGMRLKAYNGIEPKGLFQSTHPLRDATDRIGTRIEFVNKFQSTHPLRDATKQEFHKLGDNTISIHAPLTGCDVHKPYIVYMVATIFQSTHPLRDATFLHMIIPARGFISIHAPLTGCD